MGSLIFIKMVRMADNYSRSADGNRLRFINNNIDCSVVQVELNDNNNIYLIIGSFSFSIEVKNIVNKGFSNSFFVLESC